MCGYLGVIARVTVIPRNSGLILDGLGIAANFLVPEASVATAVVGSTLGVIGIGAAVIDNNGAGDAAVSGTLAYTGKQAAVAEGLLKGAGSTIGHRFGVVALAASTAYDIGKTVVKFDNCRNGE